MQQAQNLNMWRRPTPSRTYQISIVWRCGNFYLSISTDYLINEYTNICNTQQQPSQICRDTADLVDEEKQVQQRRVVSPRYGALVL